MQVSVLVRWQGRLLTAVQSGGKSLSWRPGGFAAWLRSSPAQERHVSTVSSHSAEWFTLVFPRLSQGDGLFHVEAVSTSNWAHSSPKIVWPKSRILVQCSSLFDCYQLWVNHIPLLLVDFLGLCSIWLDSRPVNSSRRECTDHRHHFHHPVSGWFHWPMVFSQLLNGFLQNNLHWWIPLLEKRA